MEDIRLNNGIGMPAFGFGTWQIPARQTPGAVLWALQNGYRLIDTSLVYWNEPEVGQAIRNSGLDREEIFVTTKLEAEYQGRTRTARGFARSMDNLDVRLCRPVPHPLAGARSGTGDLEGHGIPARQREVPGHRSQQLRRGPSGRDPRAWTGRTRVNQIELHPLQYPREVVNFCREHGIVVESYSPIGQGQSLSHALVTEIAEHHGRTPAQVVLRWHVQHGFVPIPRSANRDHIAENFQVWISR
jgi:2,5-diketo-D-gluconate reductase A